VLSAFTCLRYLFLDFTTGKRCKGADICIYIYMYITFKQKLLFDFATGEWGKEAHNTYVDYSAYFLTLLQEKGAKRQMRLRDYIASFDAPGTYRMCVCVCVCVCTYIHTHIYKNIYIYRLRDYIASFDAPLRCC